MRIVIAVATLVACVGCEEFNKLDEERRPVANPPGVAVPAGAAAPAANPAPAANNPPADNAAAQPPQQRKSAIGKTTAKVVDVNNLPPDANIQKVGDKKLNIGEPIAGAARGYFHAAARASTFGFERAVQAYQATHGKFPTYDEFMGMMKEYGIEFAQLRPYEMYGYDQSTGEIVVMEDVDLKAEIYEKYGLDPETD